MSEDNNIKKFSAYDIERYHKGQLSQAERNALEKAALDDPFLADALEGYAVEGVNVTADMEELKSRLQKRTEEKKVIPMAPGRKGFYYLRVAAAIIVLAGAGWLLYQYGFNGKKQEIAQVPQNDSIVSKNNTGPTTDTTVNLEQQGNGAAATPSNNNTFTTQSGKGSIKPDSLPEVVINAKPVTRATDTKDSLQAGLAGRVSGIKVDEAVRDEKTVAVEKTKTEQDNKAARKEDGEVVITSMGTQRRAKEVMPSPRGVTDNYYNQPNNSFRGQVRGVNNESVPFANVTNTANNSSTYTDANGYFNLSSSDSVVNVQVRSLGYEPNTARLSNIASNDIILNSESKALNEVVVTAMKKKNDEDKEEDKYDARPADGWEKYYLYLKNNIRIPADLGSKSGKDFVELTFDVKKNGKPVNISVDSSLNKACDNEAIRLLKEGPDWKKGIGKIKVYFK